MAGEDKSYAAWIRSRPCMACGCSPPVNIHHKCGAGMGLRAHDKDGMPLCGSGTTGCHGSLHSLTFGHFKGWDREKRRAWEQMAIDILQAEWLGEKMDSAPPRGRRGVLSDLPDHWDPSESEKVFYRNDTSGQLGWMCRREGEPHIREDRPHQEITKPYRKGGGSSIDDKHRSHTKFQVAAFAFEADQALRRFFGRRDPEEWQDLSNDERIRFAESGPDIPRSASVEETRYRRKIWKGNTKTLEPLTTQD